jgi:hypothetical protein
MAAIDRPTLHSKQQSNYLSRVERTESARWQQQTVLFRGRGRVERTESARWRQQTVLIRGSLVGSKPLKRSPCRKERTESARWRQQTVLFRRSLNLLSSCPLPKSPCTRSCQFLFTPFVSSVPLVCLRGRLCFLCHRPYRRCLNALILSCVLLVLLCWVAVEFLLSQ